MTNDNIAWIDCETTGLTAHKEHLLEIACIVTDRDLNILDEKGYHAVVHYTDVEMFEMMGDATSYVFNMHTETGLWGKLADGTPLKMIDGNLFKYLRRFGRTGEMPIGGNSVRLDANFMDEHLPRVSGHLSYRLRDVSGLAGFMHDWFEIPFMEKTSDHTAMTDVKESIREAKYYRTLLQMYLGSQKPAVSPGQIAYAKRIGDLLSVGVK